MYNSVNPNPQMMPGAHVPINRNMMGQPPVGMQYDPNYYGNYANPQQQHQQYLQQQMQQQQIHRDESLVKLKRLDEINGNIARISNLMIQFFDELTKDKQSSTKNKQQTKTLFEDLLKHLKKVENDLLNEITLLTMASTGYPHEGSIYGARKDFDLSKMQLHLITSQLSSLRESLNSPLSQENQDEDDSGDDL